MLKLLLVVVNRAKTTLLYISIVRKEKKNKEKKNRPTNGAPEDLGGCAEVDGAVGRLGVHAFAEEPQVLHFLPHQTTGDANLFASHDHHFLSVQQLLCHNRGEPTQHVVPGVHHHALRADPRT